jgi:hypothetical protein
MIPASEWAKTVHALDRSTTAIGETENIALIQLFNVQIIFILLQLKSRLASYFLLSTVYLISSIEFI